MVLVRHSSLENYWHGLHRARRDSGFAEMPVNVERAEHDEGNDADNGDDNVENRRGRRDSAVHIEMDEAMHES